GFNPIRSFIARKSQLSSALTNKVSTQRDLFVAKLSIHFFPCFAFRDFCFGGERRTGFPPNGFLGTNGCGLRLGRCLIHIFEYVSSLCLFAFSAVISFRSSMVLISLLPGLSIVSTTKLRQVFRVPGTSLCFFEFRYFGGGG